MIEARRLSRRVTEMDVSPTVAVAEKAAALRAAGEMVLDFSVGEPDQPTPSHIRAAAEAALAQGKTRYTSSAGLPELRAAVCQRYREDDDVAFTPEEVVITVGGKQALYLVCQALLDEGDEVVIPTPYWPTFAEAVKLAGGRPVFVETSEGEGFRVSAARIERALSARTRAVIVNSPSNPTGAVVEVRELRAIGELAKRHGLAVLLDDTYARLGFEPIEAPAPRVLREIVGDGLIVIGTASKTYCMTGWRIGWVMGPRALVNACAALVSHSTQCPATFAQYGAVEALSASQDLVREMVAEYRRRRDFVYPAVCGIPRVTCLEPAGGFYVFPSVRAYLRDECPTTLALASHLLERSRVAVVPGEGFGVPGYLRVSFARPMDELKEGVHRLGVFLRGLDAR